MRPHCWDAICYAAGTTRNGGSVTLSQSDCRELTAYVIQLTARGMAELPAPKVRRVRGGQIIGDDEIVETAPHHLAALSKYSVERAGPCGDGDGDTGPSSQRRYASDYEAEQAPQGAPECPRGSSLHDWSSGCCNKCGMCWVDYDKARAGEVVK